MRRAEARAVLAIDQGGDSGVAMVSLTNVARLTCGVMSKAEHRAKTLAAAAELAGGLEYMAVVMEDHSEIPASKAGNTATLLGMGGARDRWHEQLDLLGHPKALRFKVAMSVWRARVFHVSKNARKDRDEWKRIALQWAERHYRGIVIGHDAAEASAILEWALLERPWEAT